MIVDYVGVLDEDAETQRRWRQLFEAARKEGVALGILSNDPGGPGAEAIREWEYKGIVDAVVPVEGLADIAARALTLLSASLTVADLGSGASAAT